MLTKKLIGVMTGVMMGLTIMGGGVVAKEPVYLVTSIRTLDNEYFQMVQKGAQMFAEDMGLADYHITLLSEGSSEKQVSDLRAVLAKTGKNGVFYFDPNEAPIATRLAEICREAGVYFMTQWNKPPEIHPWDYGSYWVCHMTIDGIDSGYKTGKVLCEAIGGEGEIVALQGRLANTIAINRFKGFQQALSEYPKVKLLDARPGNWMRSLGLSITESWLVAYPEIKGVWAANDEMGLGAIEALRGAGLAGRVAVTGIDATGDAVRAVIAGEMSCTISADPYWQGGMGLSFAYHAYTGEIDPAQLSQEKREFYYKSLLIGQDNAKDYLEDYVQGSPKYDWDALWKDKWTAPIRPGE